jgi:uncharacterized peroxidase-related enzyme
MRLHRTIEEAPEPAQPLLRSVQAALGSTPNVYRVVASSPAALQGLLALSGALAGGTLDKALRERIALALANVNGCDYCNAAHTFAGRMAKLDDAEIDAARCGRSREPKADAGVRFARTVALSRGAVDEADLAELRDAGYTDEQIVEIVAHVALNTFTNYVNEVFGTPLDFPPVAPATRLA